MTDGANTQDWNFISLGNEIGKLIKEKSIPVYGYFLVLDMKNEIQEDVNIQWLNHLEENYDASAFLEQKVDVSGFFEFLFSESHIQEFHPQRISLYLHIPSDIYKMYKKKFPNEQKSVGLIIKTKKKKNIRMCVCLAEMPKILIDP